MENNTNLTNPTPILPAPGEEEVWKTCVGYEAYEVSTFGRVRRKSTQKILKCDINNKRGYRTVHLRTGIDKPNGKYVKIHRLIASTFVEKQDDNLERNEIDHIDRNIRNNYYKNLRWVTRQENNQNRKNYKDYRPRVYKKKTPIVLMDKNTNEPIQHFSCIIEASELLGLSVESIARNIIGRRKDFSIGYFISEKELSENFS